MAASQPVFSQRPNLKLWLLQQIRSGEFKGLEWYDTTKSGLMFKIPWVKEADPNWQEYYNLFHKWAARDGKQSTDSQKAKRNFRSAINHSQHFEHIKYLDKDLQTGSYKVYRFVTDEEIAARRGIHQRNISQDSQDSGITTSPNDLNLVDFNQSPGIVPVQESQGQLGHNEFASNYYNTPVHAGGQNVSYQEQLHNPTQFEQMDTLMNLGNIAPVHPTVPLIEDAEMTLIPSLDSERSQSMFLKALENIGVTENERRECKLTITYNGSEVYSNYLVNLDKMYDIVYGDAESIRVLEDLRVLRNSSSLAPHNIIQLPEQDPAHYCENLQTILKNMDTGLVFGFDEKDMSIYMIRHCKAQAFYFDVHKNDEKPVKADRGAMSKLFSYKEYWNSLCIRPAEDHFASLTSSSKSTSIPTASTSIPTASKVEVVVGCKPKRLGYEKGVRITLEPSAVPKIKASESILTEVQLSADDSLDQQFRNLKLQSEPQTLVPQYN